MVTMEKWPQNLAYLGLLALTTVALNCSPESWPGTAIEALGFCALA